MVKHPAFYRVDHAQRLNIFDLFFVVFKVFSLRKDRDITAPVRYEDPGSFVDVMAVVISDELDKFIDNVGRYKTLSSAVKLKNQMEED